jgi:F0F1-type ATP synthase assembly protein I
MSDSVGRIGLDLGVNYSSFKKELNTMPNRIAPMLQSPLKKLGMLTAAAFSLKALFNFGKGALDLASDLTEVQNVVDVTFGGMAQNINDFSKNALQSLGLSELSAKRFTSTMGAMLKSSNLAGQQMLTMSKDLTALAADMASFYNLDANVAFDKIRSGVSGMTEPLKQLGINMNIANVEAYALSKGIKKSFDKMSQAEQTLWRYKYLMEVTKDAQGDFARTSHTWANQVKLMREQWSIFTGTMGQGFINLLTPILRGLNALIQKLQIAAQYFKAFTELVFGAQESASGTTDAVSDMNSSLGDAGNAVKKAGKEAKNSLAGFDQLNTLTKQTADSLSGIEDSAEGNIDLGTAASGKIDLEVDTSSLETLKLLLEPLAQISLEPLRQSLSNLKTAIEPFTQNLFSGLQWFMQEVLTPLSTWAMQEAIPAFLNLLAGAFSVLNPLIDAFKPLALFLWNEFLQPIAKWTGGVIIDTLNSLADILGKIGDWMSNNLDLVRNIAIAVGAFFLAWKLTEVMAFIQMSGGIVGALTAIKTALAGATLAKLADKAETIALSLLYAKDFVMSIVAGTKALLAQALQWSANTLAMIANKIAMAASTIAQWAMTAATTAWNTICGIATTVTTAFGTAVAFLTSPIGLVILAIAALVAGVIILIKNWDKVKEAGSKAWEGIKDAWQQAKSWFSSNVISPLSSAFKGLFNSIIDGMNWVIRGLNKLKIKIPDWVPGFGGESWGIDIKQIPRLANGGLVSSPTLAMVGDNKNARQDPEVVAPLSKLQDIMGMTNQSVIDVLLLILEAIKAKDTQMLLKIGETEFGQTAIKAINSEQRRVGKTLLIV